MGNEPFDLFIFDTRFCCDRSEREKHTDSGLLCSYYALFYGVSTCIPPYVQKSKFSAAKYYVCFCQLVFAAYKAKSKRLIKQYIIVVGSSVLTLIVPKMFAKLKAARNWAIVMGIIGILMLGIVLVLGKITRGANLYINLGFFSFQPSGFCKDKLYC